MRKYSVFFPFSLSFFFFFSLLLIIFLGLVELYILIYSDALRLNIALMLFSEDCIQNLPGPASSRINLYSISSNDRDNVRRTPRDM